MVSRLRRSLSGLRCVELTRRTRFTVCVEGNTDAARRCHDGVKYLSRRCSFELKGGVGCAEGPVIGLQNSLVNSRRSERRALLGPSRPDSSRLSGRPAEGRNKEAHRRVSINRVCALRSRFRSLWAQSRLNRGPEPHEPDGAGLPSRRCDVERVTDAVALLSKPLALHRSEGGRSVKRRRPDRWRTNRPAPCLPFGGKYLERVARRRIGGRAAR